MSLRHPENITCIPYPFGSSLNTRSFSAGSAFRFGFNTQEKDKEIYNNTETYTATFWEYDGRLGRRWNVDPVVQIWESSYACFSNNPIRYNDPNGDSGNDPNTTAVKKGDTYWSLAKNSKGAYTVDDLKKWNKGVDPTKLNIGQRLIIRDPNKPLEKPSFDVWFNSRSSNSNNPNNVYPRVNENTSTSSESENTQSDTRDWLGITSNVSSAAGLSGTVKAEIITFAVRDYNGLSRKAYNQLSKLSQKANEVRVIGTTGSKYLKVSRGLGNAATVFSISYSTYKFIHNPTLGNGTRFVVQGAAIGVKSIPIVGWGVSIGISAADLFWGEQFYTWLDK